MEKTITRQTTPKRRFPQGVFCDGYCYDCKFFVESRYYGSEWWCTFHDREAFKNEWHACHEPERR